MPFIWKIRLAIMFSANLILRRRLCHMRVSDIYEREPIGNETKIKGWIKSVRFMKKLIFFDVSDGSTYKVLQVIAQKNDINKKLAYGSSVEVSGKLTKAPSGQLELQSNNIKMIGTCNVADGYPFLPRTKYEPHEIREHLHFRPRTISFCSMLRVRNWTSRYIHDFFNEENFTSIHTPVLTSNDCEGAGEVFTVFPESKNIIKEMQKEDKTEMEAFFDTKTFLTVSGQFHLEVMARALNNVYQFGPVFRAENSKSRLHLSEFYMIEAEVAFLDKMEDLCKLMEKLIKYVTDKVLNNHEEEILNYKKLLSLPEVNFTKIIDQPFTVLNFDEACDVLERNGISLEEGRRFSKDNELFLVKHNDNIPIFIVNWPQRSKPFYVKTNPTTDKVAAVDLLLPEVGELCGGSLREDNYDLLKQKLIQSGLLDKLNWYLDLRKFGNVSTGGFGMGFERYLMVLMGTANIKDTIPFPRWPHSSIL